MGRVSDVERRLKMKQSAEEVLQAYRIVYEKINRRQVNVEKIGGWVYVSDNPYRLSDIVRMTENLKARLSK